MERNANIVIIGGGAIGLSVAYHLGLSGGSSVHLYEANRIGSGTSWHAAGIVGPLRASLNLTRIAMYATTLFPELEIATGQSTGYRQTGGLWLARNHERLTELRRIHGMGQRVGLGVEMISPAEVRQAAPHLKVDDLVGALWVDEDGQVSPVDLCAAYAAGAKRAGVQISENQAVQEIRTKGGRLNGITLLGGERIRCDAVVLCAGLWTRALAATAGVNVPLQGVEHMYVVTQPIEGLPQTQPIVRDLDSGVYLKEDTGKMVIGGFERDARIWNAEHPVRTDGGFLMFNEDWAHFEPFMLAGMHRMPCLETAGIQMFMNGPESFTPDTKPLIGETPEVAGLYVAAGFNSVGVMSSAGVGRELAEWILCAQPRFDMWEVDITRASPRWNKPKVLRQRMRDAVHNQFAMHWPLKQPESRVGLRRSALFGQLESAGAVFGCMSHWEVPLWYAETHQERAIQHTYEAQPWWELAAREAQRMAGAVALVDLSQFSKFDISGDDALQGMQFLCAGDMDMRQGRSKYTVMLNERGGIEADVTVARFAADHFRVVSGANTRFRDRARMRRVLERFGDISIADQTKDECVLGVMGPRSRDVLQRVFAHAWNTDAFPFGHFRRGSIGGLPVIALRRSYAGELGFELYMRADDAPQVYDIVSGAGQRFGISHLGMLALDGCRLEKGFGHWSHEWGSDVTPVEANIEFAVSKSKTGYLGFDAIKKQRAGGVSQRLLLLEILLQTSARPLMLHDELVMCGDEIVGLTTSGGVGPRTGRVLSFAIVKCDPTESCEVVCSKAYQVNVAGELFETRVLTDAPYDPDGMRMRV